MKTILVCNQKGGVGKSLVADEIAFSFERSGIPVSFYDLDTQGGTLHKTHEADGAQVAVVDTPGALQEGLADWLKEADVVVIPTRTTSRDIEPLMRMRKAVFKNSRAKIVYVMNGWNRFKASRDFIRSKGDQALFGGFTTKQMKERLGVQDKRPLADFLPTLTIAAKNLATEMTNYNVEEKDLQGETAITVEHVENNTSVRDMLGQRGIKPENLPASEDIKKLERRVKREEKKLAEQSGKLTNE